MQARSVIVIGAGAAGLFAARLLRAAGAAVTVLEAAAQPGGRVRSLSGFGPQGARLELGAEELHGERSMPYRLARAAGLRVRRRAEDLRLYPDLVAGPRERPSPDADLLAAQAFFDGLPTWRGRDRPLSVATQHLPPRARLYLEVVLGNEYCSDGDHLGLRGLAHSERAWAGQGTENFFLPSSLAARAQPAGAPARASARQRGVLDLIRGDDAEAPLCDQVVEAIDWRGPGVQVRTRAGSFAADAAVVTVPLPVLRDGDIAFDPSLPAARIGAARSLGAAPAVKLWLWFEQPLWPRRAPLTLMGAPHAPELWTRGGDEAELWTGLCCGAAADRLRALGPERAIAAVVADLDQAFPSRRPSATLRAWHLQDWAAEPFIRCGYSHTPVDRADPSLRRLLAAPLGAPPRVVFAGEATHDALHGSLQGALESAVRAVTELCGAAPALP